LNASHWLHVHWLICRHLRLAVCTHDELADLLSLLEQHCRSDGELASRSVADLCAAVRAALAAGEPR
jgi:hypothetical protein